jgi:hypothetical protein
MQRPQQTQPGQLGRKGKDEAQHTGQDQPQGEEGATGDVIWIRIEGRRTEDEKKIV